MTGPSLQAGCNYSWDCPVVLVDPAQPPTDPYDGGTVDAIVIMFVLLGLVIWFNKDK